MFPTLDGKKAEESQPQEDIREKEKGWDQRFTAAKGIPEYSPLKDKHVRSYRKNLPKKKEELDELSQMKNTDAIARHDKKTWSRRKHDVINERLQAENVQNNVRVNMLIKDLEKVWLTEKIPDFYSYYFMYQLRGVTVERLQDLLTREIRLIRNKENHFVDITKSIEAREACIIQIRKVLTGLKVMKRKDDDEYQKKLRTLQEEISHLRKLTLFIIDKIKKWRDWLLTLPDVAMSASLLSQFEQSHENFTFFYGEENYLVRILNDTNFLGTTILADNLRLANKNDPFLLRPLREEKTSSNARFIEVVDCDQDLRQKMMKALEYLAAEKAEQLRSKIIPTSTKPVINERTSEAQRLAKARADLILRERKSKIRMDVNYETDIEKVEAFKQLQRQRERIERLERNQIRINAIKNIYEAKMRPKDFQSGADGPETDNEAILSNQKIPVTHAHNQSMPKLLSKPDRRPGKTKSFIAAQSQSQRKLPKNSGKEEESEFETMLRKKQIDVLKEARAPQAIKLRDRLGSKKVMEDKDGVKELEKIVGGINEGKLISNVKGMDAEIKGKIQQMKQEDKGLVSDGGYRRPPVSVSVLKQNSELIQELKGEIMAKLEKQAQQKDRIKKAQREEEMKILDEMKNKLRREFQERISEEKAKRQAERVELQQQLKAEDEKIAEQKRLEVELITKMNYEKQMREVERSKNDTLAKERQLKKRLKQEHEKRIEYERQSKKEKLKLMEELNKKAFKDTLESELKEEMREKLRRDAEIEAKAEAEKLFKQKRQDMQKEMEFIKIRQAMELEKLRQENIVRDKLLRERLDEEARRQLQLEDLMKEQMEGEKKQLEKYAVEKRGEMENQLRENARETLLDQMKAERFLQYDKDKREKEREIEEQVYREKMREKLERELRLDVIKKTKQELEQREIKKKLISDQLERAQAKLQEQVISKPIDKAKIQSEVRKEVIEKAIIDKKMEKEIAKQELRNQFEKELLGSGIPEIYSQRPDFLFKDIEMYKDNDYLKGKLEEDRPKVASPEMRPAAAATGMTNLRIGTDPASQRFNESPSRVTLNNGGGAESPTIQQQLRMTTEGKSFTTDKERSFYKLNDSQLTNERTRLGMTEEQYEIYLKKKKAVDVFRDDNNHRSIRPIEELEDEHGEYQQVVIRGEEGRKKGHQRRDSKTSIKNESLQKKKGRKKQEQEDEQDQKQRRKRKTKKMKKEATDSDEEARNQDNNSDQEGWKETKVTKTKKKPKQEEQISEQQKPKKKKGKAKKQESSEEESEPEVKPSRNSKKKQEVVRKLKKISPRKTNVSKRSFETSDSEIVQEKKKKNKKQQLSEEEEPESSDQRVIYYRKDDDEDVPSQKYHSRAPSMRSQGRPRENVPVVNPAATFERSGQRFVIKVEAVQEGELDQYLGTHILRIPKEQLVLQTLSRQDLYRKLLNEVTFSIMIGEEENKQMGMCIAYHDRNKQQSRKMVIAHIGVYMTSNLFDFTVAMCHYIFKKDPCDQVEFSLRYDESEADQLNFSNDFNGKFDRYGAIFQKKLDEDKFERKYVMKRPFNLKSEVQLGTQSKHSFVNLFTISSTLIVSNMELVQVREQNTLSQSLHPERELSYAIMVSEIFRNCLSPEEAETLKNKVKEYLKLKELLVLIVMLEKKKIKLDELKLTEFSTLVELNMRLMSQGKELIRMVKDSGVSHNRIFHCQLQQAFRLPFNFQTTTLPLDDGKAVHQINYFRMAAIAPHKLYTIKSSLYNTEMHVIPTENSKFKLFLMSAAEFNEIKDPNNIDLFMYIRVFLKNVKSHSVANWKYVWVPEMVTKGCWAIRQYRSFLDKDIYSLDSININYRQFIPGSLIIQPQHKDLVITPPFIVGILSVTLEQVSEGSPLYVRLLQSDSLKIVDSQPKQ